ncbi:hypothetical protein RI367_002767 [Sorochytrium milnesiophthora]
MDQKTEMIRRIQGALGVNRSLQSEIRQQLDTIDEMMRSKRLHEEHKKLVRAPHYSYFADDNGNLPPPNADTLARRNEPPVYYALRKWKEEERETLRRAVRNSCAEYLVCNGLMSIDRVAAMDDKEVCGRTPPEQIDWEQVAYAYFSGRSPTDCKTQWISWDDVRFAQGPASGTEVKNVVALAQKYQEHNWRAIAAELKVPRSAAWAFQTYNRHLRSTSTLRERRSWEKWEDEMLSDAVSMFGTDAWSQIALLLGTREAKQCLHRWKAIDPTIRRGKWDEEEDNALRRGVEKYGTRWSDVAKFVLGRTDTKCRERWENMLKDGLNKNEWTEQETNKLLQLVQQHGRKWSTIVHELPGRTDSQAAMQYTRLRLLMEAGEIPTPKFELPIDYKAKRLIDEALRPEKEMRSPGAESGSEGDEALDLEIIKEARLRKRLRLELKPEHKEVMKLAKKPATPRTKRVGYGPQHDLRFLHLRMLLDPPSAPATEDEAEGSVTVTGDEDGRRSDPLPLEGPAGCSNGVEQMRLYKPFTPNRANMTILHNLLQTLNVILPAPGGRGTTKTSPEQAMLSRRLKLVFTFPIIAGTVYAEELTPQKRKQRRAAANQARAREEKLAQLNALLDGTLTLAKWPAPVTQVLPRELLGEVLLHTDQKTLASCIAACSLFHRTATSDAFLARHVARAFQDPFARASLRENRLFNSIPTAGRVVRQLIRRLALDPKSADGTLMEWLFHRLGEAIDETAVLTKKCRHTRHRDAGLLRELIIEIVDADATHWLRWRDEWIMRELVALGDLELLQTTVNRRQSLPAFAGRQCWDDVLLQQAVQAGNVKTVEILLRGLCLDRHEQSGKPLVMAVARGKTDILRLFLQAGFFPAVMSEQSAALLHLTAFRGKHAQCSAMLLRFGIVPTVDALALGDDSERLQAFVTFWAAVERQCQPQDEAALAAAARISEDLERAITNVLRR